MTDRNEADFERALTQERLILEASELIHHLMEVRGVSRAELARRIGRSKSHVTQVLDGRRNMTLRTLADLAHALESEVHVSTETAVQTASLNVPVYSASLDTCFKGWRENVGIGDRRELMDSLRSAISREEPKLQDPAEEGAPMDLLVRAA